MELKPITMLRYTCGVCGNHETVVDIPRNFDTNGIPLGWSMRTHANGSREIFCCPECTSGYWEMVGKPLHEMNRKLFSEFAGAMIARKKEKE